MKTLDEVEPRLPIGPLTTPGDADSKFKISVAGSYYLTGDLIADDLKIGIEIAVSNVTIDLNGFEMVGSQLFGQGLEGIRATQPVSNIAIRNGFIRDWSRDGVDLFQGANALVENIVAANNGEFGVAAGGRAVLQRCRADGNGRTGISLSDGSIADCVVTGTTIGAGISASGSSVSRCRVESSQSGFFVSGGSVVDCVAEGNSGAGFEGSSATVFERCAAIQNGGWGFDGSAAVVSCTANANGMGGILATVGIVRGCNLIGNTNYGVSAGSSVIVTGNSCFANTGPAVESANIRVVGSNCRVDGNVVTNGVAGVRITGTDNLIIANQAADNTTAYIIAPGNAGGDILNLSAGATITTGNNWINVILD